jgi:hypothetical protein
VIYETLAPCRAGAVSSRLFYLGPNAFYAGLPFPYGKEGSQKALPYLLEQSARNWEVLP